jgi:DNA-binding Lrp family transcriptional regulator
LKKELTKRLLFELLKDSKRSDRELAKVLRVSQPTITRRRNRMVEQGVIQGFTIIPDFVKIGYEIMAITLIKAMGIFTKKDYADIQGQGLKWLENEPAIIMGGACEGMGMNSFILSLHKSYSDYNKFMLKLRLEMGDFIDDVQSILVDLRATKRLKPLHLKYLAEEEPSQQMKLKSK